MVINFVIHFLGDQSALAVGNLQFPLSVVQQMIRSDVMCASFTYAPISRGCVGSSKSKYWKSFATLDFLTLCAAQFRMYDFDSNGTMSFEGVFHLL